jgi:catechol 2,3-dioxygenase-like lactoylglutathione lyase family enzyme
MIDPSRRTFEEGERRGKLTKIGLNATVRGARAKRMDMIDHAGFDVSEPVRSRRFYDQALAPLGYKLLMEVPPEFTGGAVVLGYGAPPMPDFWLHQGTPNQPRLHVAFRAANRSQVDAFYLAAIAAGGKDNGPPGLRPHYHPNYYGAFVLDPDGHNIEAVCHTAE